MPVAIPAVEGLTTKAEPLLGRAWINRDLAWLEFNRRVLAEAADPRTPLLERVKFLAIFSANLDEFFMKRVALLRGKATVEGDEDPVTRQGDARDVLGRIRTVVKSLLAEQADLFRDELLPALADRGILLLEWRDLTLAQRQEVSALLRSQRLAGADAARPRSDAPISVHLKPVEQLGLPAEGAGNGPADSGQGQDSDHAAAVGAAQGRRRTRRAAVHQP